MKAFQLLSFPLLVLCLVSGGCGGEQSYTYGSGGNGDVPEDDDDDGEDTGPVFGGEGAPVITELQAFFEYYPTIGWVVEVHAIFEDPDGDMDSGTVHFSIEESGGELYSMEIEVDGTNAYIDNGEVIWAVDDANTSSLYTITVNLEDEAGHWSDTAEATVSG